jgi:hypothetical protein
MEVDDYPVDEFAQPMEDDIVDSDAWDSRPEAQPVFLKPLDVSPGRRQSISSELQTPLKPRDLPCNVERDSVRLRISRGKDVESEHDIPIGTGVSGTPKSVRWMRKKAGELCGKKVSPYYLTIDFQVDD